MCHPVHVPEVQCARARERERERPSPIQYDIRNFSFFVRDLAEIVTTHSNINHLLVIFLYPIEVLVTCTRAHTFLVDRLSNRPANAI